MTTHRIFGRHSGKAISDKNLGRDWTRRADKSKYRPHQGKGEADRRRRAAEAKAEAEKK